MAKELTARVTVRMTPQQHRRVIREAKREGVSISRLIVTRLFPPKAKGKP